MRNAPPPSVRNRGAREIVSEFRAPGKVSRIQVGVFGQQAGLFIGYREEHSPTTFSSRAPQSFLEQLLGPAAGHVPIRQSFPRDSKDWPSLVSQVQSFINQI